MARLYVTGAVRSGPPASSWLMRPIPRSAPARGRPSHAWCCDREVRVL